jgi:ABC-2 type transport system permease protein
MRTALSIEWLKLRRSGVVLVATAVLAGLLPAVAAAFMAAYIHGGDSQLAAKVSALVDGRTWADYLALVGQLSSMGVLLAVGTVACWTYGREFSDGTIVGLFALPVSRGRIAWAKGIVVLAWGLVTSVLGVLVAVLLGLTIDLDAAAGGEIARAAVMPIGVAALTSLLTLPLAFVASAGRGYLPGIGALLGIVVVTQFVTTLGAGAWFPWAAPGLWSGLGGPALAEQVMPMQLGLPGLVGILGLAMTAWWWQSSEVA